MKKFKVWDKKNYVCWEEGFGERYILVEEGKIIDSFDTLEDAIAFHESK